MVRSASKSWAVGLLLTLGAACGNAFHVDFDAGEAGGAGGAGQSGSAGGAGQSGSAGSTSTSGIATSGGAQGGGATGSGGMPPTAVGGGGAPGGSPSVSGGEAGGGPEPEPPSPISKEQLVYWFKADAGVSETSGRIAEWADQSGNAQHAVQRLQTQRPWLTKEATSPHPVVELDGESFLELPPIDAPIDGGLTFFAVAGRSQDSYCAAIVELSNGVEVDDVFFGHSGLTLHFEVADVWYDSDGEVFEIDALRQVTYKQSGDATSAQVELSANGAFVGRQAVPFPKRLLRSQNFIGFSQYESCDKFMGGIGEIILYSRVLGRDEQLAVEKYLRDKWQLEE
jgi:hypothetical protein